MATGRRHFLLSLCSHQSVNDWAIELFSVDFKINYHQVFLVMLIDLLAALPPTSSNPAFLSPMQPMIFLLFSSDRRIQNEARPEKSPIRCGFAERGSAGLAGDRKCIYHSL